jgi:hypothetical protein
MLVAGHWSLVTCRWWLAAISRVGHNASHASPQGEAGGPGRPYSADLIRPTLSGSHGGLPYDNA